ncbi:hypothetical protein HYPSUDRAFT_43005 [Hypholoma sublateritium FD-334 SS-4]|uniref:Uncharacterized protein n=1 Tax=Hypholoma sublateritium (strain FD-334 SS-4) TaxID=945553 RepID=A0A0D2PKM0_HYPSF|nr:hypothetical protein HYPSUDRAFT_43005 [Hypholoma sublateritium FD-334 SS-4]
MISVQTSNQLEVMFPGERIAPPPQLQYLWQNTPNFMPTQHSQPGPGDHSRTPSLRQHIRRTPNLRRHTL